MYIVFGHHLQIGRAALQINSPLKFKQAVANLIEMVNVSVSANYPMSCSASNDP